jgi:Fe2+ transport system protein FeoA
MKVKLSEVIIGKRYIVKRLLWPGRRLRKRLHDLGLTINCGFKVIANSPSGPTLVEVRGTRQALGRGMAEKIEVEEIK